MFLRLPIRLLVLVACVTASASAQPVSFSSSNLPIVILDTRGVEIPDEPKITATMSVIDNGPGQRNAVTDAPNNYDGAVGIEIRGASSQGFPKKQYSVETRDATGGGQDVSLLGLPAEEDWILYAPYSDKSLMRNVLAYHIARATGHYASRTRFCEVVLNGEYQGIYVLEEKIKRDENRVDINKLKPSETSGDDLTGGYILQIDRGNEGPGGSWTSPYRSSGGGDVEYEFDDPDGGDLVQVQKDYIRTVVTGFESAMASTRYADPQRGYPTRIDVRSFVDFILLNELSSNVDAYRLSTYLHKDKDSIDPLLHAGPAWDFNLSFGNADYDDAASASGFRFDRPGGAPFWWRKLANEPAFRDSLRTRWAELRRGVLHSDTLAAFIGTTSTGLAEAQGRNFRRWPVLGQYVWPNAYVGRTYADEVRYLRTWTVARVGWLDSQFGYVVAAEDGPVANASGRISAPVPNPSRTSSRVSVSAGSAQHVRVTVFDVVGRRVADVYEGPIEAGVARTLTLETAGLPPGVYLVRAAGETFVQAQRLTVVR